MLNKIPKILPPELVKLMMEMGHGDEMIIADGNFPVASVGPVVVRMDGHRVAEALDAILELMPLDTYVDAPVGLMQVVPGDTVLPTTWDSYREILKSHNFAGQIEEIERYAFYERAKGAFAIVATSELAQYANILLKKGIVK